VAVVAGQQIGTTDNDQLKQIEQLARTDHLALLRMCQENYDRKYSDYTCTFVKQERLKGELGDEQWIDVHFLGSPFSVAMQWTKNAPIADRLLYIEGRWNGQMLVKPKGFLGSVVGTVTRQPDGADAMKNTLRPVSLFGFRRALDSLVEVYEQAEKADDLKTEFGGYADIFGHEVVQTVTYIDLDYLVPVGLEGYNWDEELSSRYFYKDVCFNVGLGDADFAPEKYGMSSPN
jgi:hypothetical protein